ncbi:hypothetical protein GDO78_007268 [Eleutherodactylus coqui]|uniref:Uncharacterized protein n=1 Tax=Eleutherodactylus coqui TaxID=57060 RepID=A0A8J6FGR5_ELECQ|nr:hypothetical protein GDO78_007268 [Eleutherodactylus coqui]
MPYVQCYLYPSIYFDIFAVLYCYCWFVDFLNFVLERIKCLFYNLPVICRIYWTMKSHNIVIQKMCVYFVTTLCKASESIRYQRLALQNLTIDLQPLAPLLGDGHAEFHICL